MVIAVDSLGFDQFNCRQEAELNIKSAIGQMCQESVRFTHAYTPSVMSQAAVASVLTGLFPFEHGVWHNGVKFLSAKYETIAEKALTQGYRTSLYSSGAALWGFSGVQQGFEQFFDHYQLSKRQLYRPASESFELFLSWHAKNVKKEPFFSLIYLSDLEFPDVETRNELGVVRALRKRSQKEELDESLMKLMSQMRKKDIWNKTYVILLGLNGNTRGLKSSEMKGLDLRSSNTQVTLMIKPARKQRDLGLSWKVDQNVSLVDVGHTIQNIILGQSGEVSEEERGTKRNANKRISISLLPVLKDSKALENPERIIPLESSWPQWRDVGTVKYAVRKGHLLLINDEKRTLFNTQLDYFENSPIIDPFLLEKEKASVDQFFETNKMSIWDLYELNEIRKWFLGMELWQQKTPSKETLFSLLNFYENRTWDNEVAHWLAEIYIQEKKWNKLERLAQKANKKQWEFFARRAQNKPLKIKKVSGCLELFNEKSLEMSSHDPQKCSDKVFYYLMAWVKGEQKSSSNKYRDLFLQYYRWEDLDRLLAKQNYKKQMLWNISSQKLQKLSLSYMTLALPQFKKYKEIVDNSL